MSSRKLCLLSLFFFATVQTQLSATPISPIRAEEMLQMNRTLEGLKLHCCTLQEFPMVYKQNSELVGLGIDYLHKLENHLGFECSSLVLFEYPHSGFTTFLQQMEQCSNGTAFPEEPVCKCDLGVGSWTPTTQRFGHVQFLPFYLQTEIRAVVHRDNVFENSDSVFFLHAFCPITWLLIFLLLLTFTILRFMDCRVTPPEKDDREAPGDGIISRTSHFLLKNDLLRRVRYVAYPTVGEMIGRGPGNYTIETNSTRQWFLSTGITLCGIFLVLAYEAVMTASLVQSSSHSIFRTIDDITQCRINASEICMVDNSAIHSFWSNAVENQIETNCQDRGEPLLASSFEKAIEMVAIGSCKFMLEGPTAFDATTGKHCNELMITGEPLHSSGDSFVLPNNSTLFEPLAKETMNLYETGRLTSIDEFFKRRGECSLMESTSLGLKTLKPFFIVAFCFCGLMFIVMVLFPQHPAKRSNNDDEKSRNCTEKVSWKGKDFDESSESLESSESV